MSMLHWEGVMKRGVRVALPFLVFAIVPLEVRAADPEPATIEAAGLTFPALVAGAGAPVVFVHGSFSDRRVWEGVAPEVAENHRFIAYDQRGFGTGAWPASPYSRDAHTADLIAILKTLGEPANLVGWSYSGPIVLRAAAEVPELVRSVVVYEPTMPEMLSGDPEAEAARDAWFGIWADTDAAVKAGDNEEAIREGIEAALGMPEGGFETQDPALQRMQLENAHTVPLDWSAPPPTDLLCDELATIEPPTLIIAGAATHPAWTRTQQAVAACIPGAETATIEGVGHGGPVAAEAEFLRLTLGFIDAH
jgi:pimeloyl-ACP methyl ester carboxylesterase